MKKLVFSLLLATFAGWGQYAVEPVATPPAGVPGPVSEQLGPGSRIVNSGKVVCEIWFRKDLPAGPKSTEPNVTLPQISHGAFLGVMHFPAPGSDRRGQTIKPGTYLMRYSNFPENGDHQGVAPQRDFLILTPIAADQDTAFAPKFEELMELSRKASGTPHPAVFSFWKDEAGKSGFELMGDHDWVLHTTIGELPVAVILIGRAEG